MLVFIVCVSVVVVVCLPRPMEGIFRSFFTELPVPPQAAGVVGTFNVLDIYPSEHYGLSFFGPYGCLFFLQGLLFFNTVCVGVDIVCVRVYIVCVSVYLVCVSVYI